MEIGFEYFRMSVSQFDRLFALVSPLIKKHLIRSNPELQFYKWRLWDKTCWKVLQDCARYAFDLHASLAHYLSNEGKVSWQEVYVNWVS